ncbi:MAG TPA: DUF4332 domain-containing protein [candidate division Zixibacteria bacterium]|nr:DUF4332 domain-containing protein [candidate division Zixibacteria bacterium]
MDEDKFRKFLKSKGKKSDVVERNIQTVKLFNEYLSNERNSSLAEVTEDDIEAYVEKLENEKLSAKGHLYVLMNYFRSVDNKVLLNYTRMLREERTKKTRRIFPIKEFMNIDQKHVKKLAAIGIKNVDQMLEAGRTKAQREEISKELGTPEPAILEIVKLSDLTRMGYIKTKLTRLYYDSGLDSPLKVAQFEPEELHKFFTEFVTKSGWDGMIPNLKDLVGNVASARKLKKLVED